MAKPKKVIELHKLEPNDYWAQLFIETPVPDPASRIACLGDEDGPRQCSWMKDFGLGEEDVE
jgi:hypothetical protein